MGNPEYWNMEQDVENNVREDSILLFDDRMLNKLRGCNIVPRSPSDFQDFVKSLAGDTISDVVIQEVWKQIYPENASLPTSERDSDWQELTLNDSTKSEWKVVDFLPEFSISSGKVPNQKYGSQFDNEIFKEIKKSSSESNVNISYSDPSFSDRATRYPISNQHIVLHSFAPVSRSEENRKVTSPVKTVEEIKQSCAGKSNETDVLLEGDRKEEQNSSDCEIIEIVPLNSSGANKSSSGSEIVSNDDGNKSDSDASVEILDSSGNETDEGVNRQCPVHGSHKRNALHGNSSKRKSVPVEADSVESKENESCEESVNKGKKQKGKKGKRKNYQMLKSEVKHMKSILCNLLLSLECPMTTDSKESCKKLENFSFTLVNNQKTEGNESFGTKQRRKKTGSKNTSRVSSTAKLHSSTYVEVNVSPKTTELPSLKKHVKNSSEQPPVVVDLDSDIEDKEKRKKFRWRENIVYALRSTPGKWMTLEKLKRMVIAHYYYCRGNVSKNTTVKFLRYLHSTAGVIVDGDMAIYSNKPIMKVTEKSERKQFVVKSHTTTKKYKVS